MKQIKSYEIEDDQKVSLVGEAFVQYYSKHNMASNFTQAFQFQNLQDLFSNKLLLVHTIQSGIGISLFESIKTITPFSDVDWCDFLNISTKSMHRYKNDSSHVFKPIHSEKIIELAEVSALGHEVFDSTEQFYSWLKTPSFALGNMKPLDLLKDSYGKEMVLNELHKIDQGVFA